MPITGRETLAEELITLAGAAAVGAAVHYFRVLSDGRETRRSVFIGKVGSAAFVGFGLPAMASWLVQLTPTQVLLLGVVGGYFGRAMWQPLLKVVEQRLGMRLTAEEIDAPPGPPIAVLGASAGAGDGTVDKKARENGNGRDENETA